MDNSSKQYSSCGPVDTLQDVYEVQAVAAKYELDSTMWSHTEIDKEIKQWQLWVQIRIDQKCEAGLL